MVVKLILFLDRIGYFGESVYVFDITSHTFNISTRTAYSQRFYHSVSYTFSQFLKLPDIKILLLTELTELNHQRREECRKIRNAINGTMAWVLEHQNLIIDISRRIVHRGSRNQHHLLFVAWYITCLYTWHLTNLLQLLESARSVIAEFMCFVYKHKVIFVGIPNFIVIIIKNLAKTTIRDETSILLNTKVLKCGNPVLLYCRWVNHKNLGIIATIFYQELLGYHGGNNGLSKSHNIS